MTRWEYVWVTPHQVNDHGLEGWEAVGVADSRFGSSVLMKRPLDDTSVTIRYTNQADDKETTRGRIM